MQKNGENMMLYIYFFILVVDDNVGWNTSEIHTKKGWNVTDIEIYGNVTLHILFTRRYYESKIYNWSF